MSGELSSIRAPDTAHIAICPGCETPVLAGDFVTDSAAMQCPRCGTFLRPTDINTYVHEREATDE